MDLSYTETQRMLLDVARTFVANEVPKSRVREIDDSPAGFSPDLWRQMTEIGLPGMAVAEAHGGSASTLMDYAVVFEALGEGAAPSPLLANAFAAYLLAELRADDALLRSIAAGERLAVVALTEPDYGWESSNVAAVAEPSNGGYVLSGVKSFVPYAHVADELLVVANAPAGELYRHSREGGNLAAPSARPEPVEPGPESRSPRHSREGGNLAAQSARSEPVEANSLAAPTVFRVPAGAPGLTVRRQSGWLGEPVCEINLAGVPVDRSAIVGSEGGAWPAIERAMDKAAALLCAYMLGGAQRVADMAIEYSKTRIAFGVPIGTFQRVQDLVVAALNDADAIRWSAYEALWKLDEARPDAAVSVSMAKAIASESFPRACESSHYVHAGIGMDLDYGLTHHTKRSRFYGLYLGGPTHHKLRMARLLGLPAGP